MTNPIFAIPGIFVSIIVSVALIGVLTHDDSRRKTAEGSLLSQLEALDRQITEAEAKHAPLYRSPTLDERAEITRASDKTYTPIHLAVARSGAHQTWALCSAFGAFSKVHIVSNEPELAALHDLTATAEHTGEMQKSYDRLRAACADHLLQAG